MIYQFSSTKCGRIDGEGHSFANLNFRNHVSICKTHRTPRNRQLVNSGLNGTQSDYGSGCALVDKENTSPYLASDREPSFSANLLLVNAAVLSIAIC